MYCPKCKAEYVETITVCPNCNLKLVKKLSENPADDFVEFVTILKTGNQAITAIAKSILDEAEIKYFATGEHMQGVFGMGLGFAPSATFGEVEIKVSKEDREIAEQLLEELKNEE